MATSQGDCLRFPPGFLLGAATASYQVEGGWDEDGKGENTWDRLAHTRPELVAERASGDVACDSYHRYKEDVRLIKEMGMDFYRFSVSWSRVLPTGASDQINYAGINYYNNLINELLANNIQPMVTMFHWDLPQTLQELGGWPNPHLAYYFMDYARILFKHFGDRVKWWITFNEPSHTCRAYSSQDPLFAPCLQLSHLGAEHLSVQTILKAHAMVYHMYKKEFCVTQKGKIGITLHSYWCEPKTNSKEDIKAARAVLLCDMGLYSHPIYSEKGDFPEVAIKTFEEKRKARGISLPYLPSLGEEWVNKIKGTADFFGLNHYTTRWISPGKASWWIPDLDVSIEFDENMPGAESVWLKTVPWGFRKLLQWIKNEYNNPPIFITENGFSDKGEIHDPNRIKYYVSYLKEMLNAIHEDKCNIIGYAAWSLLDNFEWLCGYQEKFGLHHVDFNDPARPRKAKTSARILKNIIQLRKLPENEEVLNSMIQSMKMK